MEPLLHGILLAFGLILPLGIQNVFIFNQGATQPRFYKALPAIISAAVCDTLLILLAVAGVSVVVLRITSLALVLSIIGFFFLLFMGWVMWKSTPVREQPSRNHYTARRQITFAASVSLLNPHAIMDTIGVIGTSSIVYDGNEKLLFTTACILVSWLWFFGIAFVGRKIGQYDQSGKFLKRLNQISAILIWGMALLMGYQILY